MAGMAAMMISLVAITSILPLSFPQKLAAGGATGVWVGLASGLAAAGDLAFSPQHPVPLVGVLFATPLLTALAFWLAVPRFRAALMAIPMPLLIGLNIARVFGGLFLLLAAAGRLSGPFPYFAGLGDVITSLLAFRLALTAMRGGQMKDGRIAAWNRFGALDLVRHAVSALVPGSDRAGAILFGDPRHRGGPAFGAPIFPATGFNTGNRSVSQFKVMVWPPMAVRRAARAR
jgi:hypothetical protein